MAGGRTTVTRVALLGALLVASAWAFGVRRARDARRSWDRTLQVAVVAVAPAPVDPAAVEALRAGLDAAAERLREEVDRYRPGAPAPFAFELVGPVSAAPPPFPPDDGGLLVRARHAWALWLALRQVHAAAPGFSPRAYDVRVYLALAPPGPGPATFAEGAGEVDGDVALVRARAAARDPVLAVAAVAHELLHCVGASDKYGPDGHPVAPHGLADPGRRPLYPQVAAELMGVEVALAPGRGRLPRAVDELAVGPATAAEIGWTAP